MTAASDRPRYSVVVPFFNEEANAPSLVAEIEAAMDALGEPWELLMVDDGSRDGTESLLAAAAARRPELRSSDCRSTGVRRPRSTPDSGARAARS